VPTKPSVEFVSVNGVSSGSVFVDSVAETEIVPNQNANAIRQNQNRGDAMIRLRVGSPEILLLTMGPFKFLTATNLIQNVQYLPRPPKAVPASPQLLALNTVSKRMTLA
jgi:hypothetical protein